jgi:lycopene beta-cyclase
LQSSLIALALFARRPGVRVAMIERGPHVGGNHTWCFHADDVPSGAKDLVAPLIAHRWPAYEVAFPRLMRRVEAPYAAITATGLARVVKARFEGSQGSLLCTGVAANKVGSGSVTLSDGRTFEANLVVDARGPENGVLGQPVGYQKFVGLELELSEPHGLQIPRLMDARVPQLDGFRFVYLLPFAERRLLIEDTYFADQPRLEVAEIGERVLAYARTSGFEVKRVIRAESGILPLPSRRDPPPPAASPLVAGYAGGWFHPGTAYSFPVALRLAMHVAQAWPGRIFDAAWDRLVGEHRAQFRFAALLNRMIFAWFEPAQRYRVFERFYRLPDPTIGRFYALRTTARDRLRILCGSAPAGLALKVLTRQGAST